MFRRARTSHSSRILGRFSHFGYDPRVWAETEWEGSSRFPYVQRRGLTSRVRRPEKNGLGMGMGIWERMGNTNAPLLT